MIDSTDRPTETTLVGKVVSLETRWCSLCGARTWYARRLARLRTCAGQSCR